MMRTKISFSLRFTVLLFCFYFTDIFSYTLEMATRFISKSGNHDRLLATRAIETSPTWEQTMQRDPDFSKTGLNFGIAAEIIRSNALFLWLCFTDPLHIGRTV